ncbi:MAG: L-serine ammonia-lyase, iron-sulfur-dependent, subunit alpha [bacterium]
MKRSPSIFNDVIGPVMRGPSSSHTAASVRIASLARMLLGAKPVRALFEFTPDGSLATTYAGQGSDIGLASGLLGYSLYDDRLPRSLELAKAEGLSIEFKISNYTAEHPNTYKVTLWSSAGKSLSLIAISTGGGMIEVLEVDTIPTDIQGDSFELLLFFETPLSLKQQGLLQTVANRCESPAQLIHPRCANIKSSVPFSTDLVAELRTQFPHAVLRMSEPVLPTRFNPECEVPFLTATEMADYARKHQKTELWELAAIYESRRGDMPIHEVIGQMRNIVHLMKASVASGKQGTQYHDRILDAQAPKYCTAQTHLIQTGAMNSVIQAVLALMDVKSSMGVIVAAPTAGSCAALPGSILGVAESIGADDDACAKAMLAAGLIGVFITHRSTFSAEVAGCQAECGAASGMATAGITTLMHAPLELSLTATSLALQNILGMICDPVANRVEVPCMGKNVMAAVNALACANMAVAGIPCLIPLDEVIETMDAVGKAIPRELRCTALGGLSITPSAKAIEAKLACR